MKKIKILAIFLMIIPGIVIAQQKDTESKTDSSQAEITRKPFSKVVRIKDMDQRKIYNWEDGQRSTATGRQAGDRKAKYARVFGDSAIVVRKPSKNK